MASNNLRRSAGFAMLSSFLVSDAVNSKNFTKPAGLRGRMK
jgi:hypothetical protein